MSKELGLFPVEPAVYQEIPMDELEQLVPEYDRGCIPPDASTVDSVRKEGVLHPILLIRRKTGNQFDLAAGRRRIAANRLAGHPTIPARIFPYGWKKAAVITLVENEIRKPNMLAAWLAVEELLKARKSLEDIHERTNFNMGRLKALMVFQKLHPVLMQAFKESRIKPSVAQLAAKKKPKVQKRLAAIFEKTGKLLAAEVREEARKVKKQTMESLPDDLFGAPELDWKEIANTSLSELHTRIEDKAPKSVLDHLNQLRAWIDNVVSEPAERSA